MSEIIAIGNIDLKFEVNFKSDDGWTVDLSQELSCFALCSNYFVGFEIYKLPFIMVIK